MRKIMSLVLLACSFSVQAGDCAISPKVAGLVSDEVNIGIPKWKMDWHAPQTKEHRELIERAYKRGRIYDSTGKREARRELQREAKEICAKYGR